MQKIENTTIKTKKKFFFIKRLYDIHQKENMDKL